MVPAVSTGHGVGWRGDPISLGVPYIEHLSPRAASPTQHALLTLGAAG